MKIWFLSDTHGHHDRICVPLGLDAVIHCGDESESRDPAANVEEARAFFGWFENLEIEKKIFVPGNHSIAVEQKLVKASEFPSIQFLVHEMTEWRQLRIFGSPYTPQFFDWAFMKSRGLLASYWQQIPNGIDILITHGPPKGIRDLTADMNSRQPIHVGSKSLADHVVQRIQPRIHAFGHIHDEGGISNYGSTLQDGIQYINCSCCDVANRLRHQGLVVDLCENRKS